MTETLSMKEMVLKAMENLPEEDTIDEAMERLYFLSKIEEGVQDLENGRVHTHEEIEAMVGEWLK
jgi:predicted transcriptional regulator